MPAPCGGACAQACCRGGALCAALKLALCERKRLPLPADSGGEEIEDSDGWNVHPIRPVPQLVVQLVDSFFQKLNTQESVPLGLRLGYEARGGRCAAVRLEVGVTRTLVPEFASLDRGRGVAGTFRAGGKVRRVVE